MNYLSFKKDARLSQTKRFDLAFKNRKPCLTDNTNNTSFDRHYIYHPAWAARILKAQSPDEHIDISSTLHFCTVISSFMDVKFYDYRPPVLNLPGLKLGAVDLCKLPFSDASIASLSCMHTVEHVGLGRYGDEIDYSGDIKAMRELARVLSIGGNLLFVVPIANSDYIQFNAHRVYRSSTVIDIFHDLGLKLFEFTLIPESEEDGGLILNPSRELLDRQRYGCGCFWFVKE